MSLVGCSVTSSQHPCAAGGGQSASGTGTLGCPCLFFKPTDFPVPETVPSSVFLRSLSLSLPLPFPLPSLSCSLSLPLPSPLPPQTDPLCCPCFWPLLCWVLSAHSCTQVALHSACPLGQLTLLRSPAGFQHGLAHASPFCIQPHLRSCQPGPF